VEPRIQYAKTRDGVSIAYWTLGEGEGTPYVLMAPSPFSHIQLEWEFPEWRDVYERIAQKRMLVRYDGRGSGLSDRSVREFSLETHLLDLEAVIESLGLDKIILGAYGDAGPPATVYAARQPALVSYLILIGSYVRPRESSGEATGLRALVDKDWRLLTETLARASVGWSSGEVGERLASLLRECTTPEATKAAWDASMAFDVTELLPQIQAQTLVIHPRQVRWLSLDQATVLASAIPAAQLRVVDGYFGFGLISESMSTIDEFLGEGEEEAAATAAPSGLVTILFTDVEGSTALTQRLGDASARDLLREHERMVREALKAHGGSELKTTGDGFMASFSSATKALECSIAMQRAFAARNESAVEPILVRVGVNAGEPIAEDEDLFGTAVIEAARIAAAAKGGEILVSDVVRQLAKGKDFLFADRGDVDLKGFDEPVRLYEVRWED
jgi:class 3 adenylate cyclase